MIENSITEGTRLIVRDINDEMESAFIDYSMSVITQRALPDVRDGLKPVHRRIFVHHARARKRPQPPHAQICRYGGCCAGLLPPARRRLCVRRHGAPGAGFFPCATLWWTGRATLALWTVTPCCIPLHGSAHEQAGGGASARHRQGHSGFCAQL